MKAPEKNKVKKQKTKKKPIEKNKKQQVLVVAQEFKFARLLSGNEKKTRDKVLKTLKKWLLSCFEKEYEFKEDDFIRVWKGLFYAVWMSDKPLVQEELCESIAEILDLFPPDQLKFAIMMTKAGLKVLAMEWYGIDQHRMDKFLMLVRRYLRGSLRCLLRCDWNLESCQMYSKMLMGSDGILCNKTPQYAKNAMSMILHVIDCYLEELAKVSNGKIPEDSIAALLLPFTSLVCSGEALVVCAASRRLLTGLLRQSEPGLRYQEATRAWQKMGCPAGGPEALELVSDDEGETEETGDDFEEERPSALDPRAGRVNVYLPLLPVPASQLAEQLRQLMAKASSKAYKRASICLQRFEALSKNEYPLVVPEAEASGRESPLRVDEPSAAGKLRALEKQLVTQSDELALRGLKRKHRKRLLAKSRAGHSIVDELPLQTDSRRTSTNGDWQVEDTEPDSKKKKKDSSTSDVIKKKENRKRKVLQNGDAKVKKVKKVDSSPIKSGDSKMKVNKNKLGSDKTVKKTKEKKISLISGCVKKTKSKIDKESKQKLVKNVPKVIGTDKVKKQKIVTNETNKGSKKDLDNGKAVESNKKKIDKIDNSKEKTEKVDSTNNKMVKTEAVHSSKKKLANNSNKPEKTNSIPSKGGKRQKVLPMNKIKNYQKQISPKGDKKSKESPRKSVIDTPKKVKFVLKNNSMQGTMDYFKSVRQSPNIPFDSSKMPTKTNLKPSTPSPINPFFKKKMKLKGLL